MSKTTETETPLYAISLEKIPANGDDDLWFCLRAPRGVAWKLGGVDRFIGELITWRDQFSRLIADESESD